jgi:hypothetical protein
MHGTLMARRQFPIHFSVGTETYKKATTFPRDRPISKDKGTGLTENYLRVVQAQVEMTPLEKRKIDQERQVGERERVWSRW